jgi:hypothetical protein
MSSTPTQITAAKLRDLVVALKWLYRQLTNLGAVRVVVVPSPSSPLLLSPQQ